MFVKKKKERLQKREKCGASYWSRALMIRMWAAVLGD